MNKTKAAEKYILKNTVDLYTIKKGPHCMPSFFLLPENRITMIPVVLLLLTSCNKRT